MIDPRALRTFHEVCRAGSISAAARALNLSQPSVSAAIAQLEARLGTVLFERRRSGVVLTPAGRALAARAEAMVHLLVSAAEEVENVRAGVAGPLRIGGTPGALVSLLPKAIGEFERAVGPFSLSIIERPDGVLIDLLRRREIDLAFVTTEIEQLPADIGERTFARDPFALLVGRAHDHLGAAVSLGQISHLPWVLPEAQGAFRRQVDALFLAASVPVPRDVIRCDSLLTTKAIVRATDRVTVLPREVAAAELTIGALRAIDIAEAAFARSTGVRYLTDGPVPEIAQLMMEVLGRIHSLKL